MAEQMDFEFVGGEPEIGPLTLGGLGGLIEAIPHPGAAGPPEVSALSELAARLVAGCTSLDLASARSLPAAEALELVEKCLAANDLAALVERARRTVRLASEAVGSCGERSPA